MHVVVRHYERADELFDFYEQHEAEIRELFAGIPGFGNYYFCRTEDGGGITITICQDEAGVDESTRRAAAWTKEKAAHIKDDVPNEPRVIEGDVVFTITGEGYELDPTGMRPGESGGEPVVE